MSKSTGQQETHRHQSRASPSERRIKGTISVEVVFGVDFDSGW